MLDEDNRFYYGKNGKVVKLSIGEGKFLALLIDNNHFCTYEMVVEKLYPKFRWVDAINNTRIIVCRLREKLGDEIDIYSRRNIGYKLEYIGG